MIILLILKSATDLTIRMNMLIVWILSEMVKLGNKWISLIIWKTILFYFVWSFSDVLRRTNNVDAIGQLLAQFTVDLDGSPYEGHRMSFYPSTQFWGQSRVLYLRDHGEKKKITSRKMFFRWWRSLIFFFNFLSLLPCKTTLVYC